MELEHYGTPRHSGRYPWGSGENPYQSSMPFARQIRQMKADGVSEKNIADFMGMSVKALRAQYSIAKDDVKAYQAREAVRLKDKGYSNQKIGEILGEPGKPIGESTVRNLLKPTLTERSNVTKEISNVLKGAVDQYKFVDVGSGVEPYLGVSSTKLETAIELLKQQGYSYHNLKVEQLGTGFKTTVKVLCPEGTTAREVYQNLDKIELPIGKVYSEDGGRTWSNIHPPVGVDAKRVAIRYAEDGGVDMDGVIQLRPGIQDISLGSSQYAQVRIQVGKDRYLKGMACYSDDLPDGVDLMFNTNKTKDVPFNEVLKKTKDDPDNPFGATIVRQNDWTDDKGIKHQGVVNIVNDEGTWEDWSRTLSTQFLSKQPVSLAKKQLDLTYDEKKKEYDEIMALTNPDVKRKLLESFSDECDSAAIHMKAKAIAGQSQRVLLPLPDISENECYAPGYKDGEQLVLVRYPHAGRFEIPTVTVNNKLKSGKTVVGEGIDAIGINPKIAQQLSGADFDGDSVVAIPNPSGAIKTMRPLASLKDFDPNSYANPPTAIPTGPKNGFNTGREMGMVSNLITDMTIGGADYDEIARAVRHSMVVIDAEKHNLDWRRSYEENGIAALNKKYQGKASGGAATLISRRKGRYDVPERKMRTPTRDIDPITGEKIYRETGRTYVDYKTGKVKRAMEKITKLEALGPEALSSGSKIEGVYAEYSNRMRALANKARLSLLDTPTQKYSVSAAKTYANEVESLKSKLNVSLMNSPLERQAQLYANMIVTQKRNANPDMTNEEYKRLKGQTLSGARARVGAHKEKIEITPSEWEAIQAGAINHTTLVKILSNTDSDVIRRYATPKSVNVLSSSQRQQIIALMNSGANQADVAQRFGVSVSTIYGVIKGKS